MTVDLGELQKLSDKDFDPPEEPQPEQPPEGQQTKQPPSPYPSSPAFDLMESLGETVKTVAQGIEAGTIKPDQNIVENLEAFNELTTTPEKPEQELKAPITLDSLQELSDGSITLETKPPVVPKAMTEQERFHFSRKRRAKRDEEKREAEDAFFTSRDARDRRNARLAFFDTATKTIDYFTTGPLAAVLNLKQGMFGFPSEAGKEEDAFFTSKVPSGGINLLTKEIFRSEFFGLKEGTPIPEDIPNSPLVSAARDAGAVAATFMLTPFGANIKMLEGAVTGGNLKNIMQGLRGFDLGKLSTGVSGLAVKAKEGVKGMAKSMGESFKHRRQLTTSGELVGGLATGYARFHLEESFPNSPVTRFVGEVTAGSTATAVTYRLSIKAGKAFINMFKSGMDSDTTIVQKRLQQDLDDIGTEGKDSVIARLEEGELIPHLQGVATASQTSGSHLLASIHAALVAQTSKLTHQQQVQFEEFNTALLEFARETVSPQKIAFTKQFLLQQQQSLRDTLEVMVENAKKITAQTIKDFEERGIKLTVDDANRIAQEQLEFIRKAATTQSEQLYDAIPDLVKFTMNAPHDALMSVMLKRSRSSDPADVPGYIAHFFGKVVKNTKKEAAKTGQTYRIKPGLYKKTATAKELRQLRSRLMKDARKASADDQPESAALLNELAEGVRKALSEITDDLSDEAVHHIKAAHDFTNKFHNVFTRGHIAPLMKHAAAGGKKLQPDDFLDMGVKGHGRRKAKTIKAIITEPKKLIDEEGIPLPEGTDPNQLLGAVEDWVKGDFVRRFIEDNNFISDEHIQKAINYMRANKETFDLFPKIKEDLQKMIDTGDSSSVFIRRVHDLGVKMGDPNVSKAAMFIQQKTGKAFDSIRNMDGVNVDQEIQRLLKLVNEDTTGEALEGFQAAFFNWIIERGRGKDATLLLKEAFLDSTLLTQAINDPATKVMAYRILNKSQLDRLELIRDATERLSISRRTAPSKEGVTGAKLGSNLSTLVSVVGAQLGRKVASVTGGGTVQTPGIFAARLRQLVEAGVADPVLFILKEVFLEESGEMLIELLKEIKSPEQVRKTLVSLGIWLANPISRLGGSYIPAEQE